MRRHACFGLGLLGLGLAACAAAKPELSTPNPSVVASPSVSASEVATTADSAAAPSKTPVVPAVEQRIAWYGLSLDLSDTWLDQTNYGFEAAQGAIEKLAFEPSDLQAAQVRPWLEEVRKRVDGAYGAKPSVVEVYENPSFAVLGVRIRFNTEYLYDIFVALEDRVLGVTIKCRAECDAGVRDLVRSLSTQEPSGASGAPHRYRIPGLTFDAGQRFDAPREFVLGEKDSEHRIFCSRGNTPPKDSELPSEIHWSLASSEALAQVPRVEETLQADGNAPKVRLYQREGYVPDELGQTVFASSSSAVIAIGSDIFTCHLRLLPSFRPVLTRFHRLFETVRYE
jgi:hypothetical protein